MQTFDPVEAAGIERGYSIEKKAPIEVKQEEFKRTLLKEEKRGGEG